MVVANQRRHNRVKHQAKIQVVANAESYTFEMRDFSDSGLYLFCDDTSIVNIQEQVKVQTLEFEGAPVLDAEVVRLEENIGFAVEFIQ
jgi:c-di-GMP-binding flagellar brake protein YcgR